MQIRIVKGEGRNFLLFTLTVAYTSAKVCQGNIEAHAEYFNSYRID